MSTIPTFSIVIPTRNRFNTFRMALNSVLNQNFSDYELIISDNSFPVNNEIKDYIESKNFPHNNVRFFQTDGKLPMYENWENASVRAKGEYVLILPDRWIMLQGVLRLLKNVIEKKNPDCIFWGARHQHDLLNNNSNQIMIYYEEIPSQLLLSNLLLFNGYKDGKVFSQPFPRGLNSAYKNSLVNKIRNNIGSFFRPASCDYTSGISILTNTSSMIEIFTALYSSVGNESNGARNSIHGLSDEDRNLAVWRGLDLNCVFLTVLNDIENTLKLNGRSDLLNSINVSNVLLSTLSELHFKEWHGSTLDTLGMRESIINFISKNKKITRANLLYEFNNFDDKMRPNFLSLRKFLVRLGVFYYLYDLKWKLLNNFGKINFHASEIRDFTFHELFEIEK